MKRLAAAAIAILLAGCSPPSHIRRVHDVADIEALFRIDLCDKAKVVSEGSTPPLTSVKELLIDFPNTRCVEDFFRAMKRDGRGEDILEGREYFRIIGGQEKADDDVRRRPHGRNRRDPAAVGQQLGRLNIRTVVPESIRGS